MPNATPHEALVDLETKFWQSMVDQNTDAALEVLNEPALMVSAHGSMKFDHSGYRKMADKGSMVLTSFEFSDMDVVFPNEQTALLTYRVKQGVATRGSGRRSVQEMNDSSTWIQAGAQWKCVLHTETPAHLETAPDGG